MKYAGAGIAAGLCVLLALVGALTTDAAEKENISAAIEKANKAFMAAFARGDAEALAAMYTPGAMLLPPEQGIVEGKAAIQEFWNGVIDSAARGFILTTREAERRGNTAYELGTYVMTDENEKTMDMGKYVVIWKHYGGGWKLHRDIWNTSITQPET